jgi:hypothetical protein
LKQQQAVALVAPYESYIGTGLGKYTITLGETSYTSFDDFEDAVEAWSEIEDCVVPTIAINQPTSAFYRFHIGSNYMCSDADNEHIRMVTETSDGANTIFYLNANNYLIDYTSGFGFNFGYCKATEAGIFNSFDFSASETKGSYLIHSNAGTGNSQWSDRYITISESKLGQGQGVWTIEPVESLPVTIGSTTYATLFAPVALTIPSRVQAYYVSNLTETEATLTEIATTIPASTPVVLKAEAAGTYDFAITTGGTDVSASNKLAGQAAAFAVSADDVTNKVYYTLQQNATHTAIGFYPKTTAGSIAGFKAYLPSSNFPSAGVKGLTFIFEDDADAIEMVKGQSSMFNGQPIYNLAGQRISKMQRGINIVNGKKVMVK